MKALLLKLSCLSFIFLFSFTPDTQEFQGKAYYMAKSTMDLGSWGARMSEAQKKQVMARLKNRLEKTYVLSFDKTSSVFNEEDKLDAMSGATDSWGQNFTQGEIFKNVKENALVQSQEFYGKQFLVKDKVQEFQWQLGKESKMIGNYMCFKATTAVPSQELEWYNFSWGELRQAKPDSTGTVPEIKMTQIEAWYTPQIPVSHGPSEYGGLPGLILEVSAGNTTMVCTKIVMNPEEKIKIEAPSKGKEITKAAYKETITTKMMEMRNNRGRRRG